MGLKMRGPLLATPDRSVARVPTAAQHLKLTMEFYGSAAWKAVRAEVVRERGRVCQACGRIGMRPFVDHIVEVKDGGDALAKSNLQVLCGSCHTAKTAAAKARRHPSRA